MTTEDNQSAEIRKICTKSQESTGNITEGGEDEWLISIEDYVKDTTKKPQLVRVPSLLREIHKDCFDPLVVSIGPYHHGKPKLKTFEELKIPIAQKFFHACENQVSIEQVYKAVASEGKSARECYEKCWTDSYDDKLFNKMMFLDACFVLHVMFILNGGNASNGTDEIQKEVDPLQDGSCYLAFVQRDLLLLENQIPLKVLIVLMEFRFRNESEWTQLIQNFIDQKVTITPPQKSEWTELNQNFVDLTAPQKNTCTKTFEKLYARMMGRCDQEKKESSATGPGSKPDPVTAPLLEGEWGLCPKNEGKLDLNASPHLLHLVREQLIGPPPGKKKSNKSNGWHSYRSVTELKSKGIHSRPSQTFHITDVEFKRRLVFGTLTLPPISVDDSTKPFLLNLVAYEMSPHGASDYRVMSYIWLMDSLIDNANDVKELRKNRILVNNLGSDEHLADLFNEISIDLVPDLQVYADTKQDIEDHCQNKGLVWMAEWLYQHFSSPWTTLTFIGAILVLVLTAIQTYFAIFPRKTAEDKTS